MSLSQNAIDQLNLTSSQTLPNNIAGSGIASGLAAVSQLTLPTQPAASTGVQAGAQPTTLASPIDPLAPIAAPVDFTQADQSADNQVSGPVYSNLPQAQADLTSKYANGAYSTLPPDVLGALQATDIARVANGAYPLSKKPTLLAAQAATTKSPATPAKNRSLWDIPGNALQDLIGIGESIPRIPGALIKEAERLPQLPQDLAKVRSIQDVTRLPGVDLIPGAHTIGDIASGTAGLKDLITHPLNTALDVLPGAESLAELTPAAKLAEETAQANVAAGESPLENRVNPITTALSKKVVTGDDGEQVLANRALGNAADAIRNTRAGQAFQASFGAQARVDSQIIRGGNATLQYQAHDLNGDAPSQVAATNLALAQPSSRTMYDQYGMTKAEGAAVYDKLQLDPQSVSQLPPNQQQYAADIKLQRAQMDQWALENQKLAERGGEIYRPQEATTIDRRARLFQSAHVNTDTRFTDLIGKYVAPTGVNAQGWRDMVNQAVVSGDGDYRDIIGNPNIPTRPLPPKLQPLVDTYGAYLDGNATAKDLKLETNKLALGRTNLGSTSNVVGANAVGEAANPVTSLAEFQNFRKATDRLSSAESVASRTVVPARFQPAIADAAQRQYIEYKFTDPSDIANATEMARQGLISQVDGFSAKDTTDPLTGDKVRGLLSFMDEVAPTWEDMKAKGVDPTYLHSVSPQAADSTFFPKVTEVPQTPASLKARTLDMTPTFKDANLSLASEAVDYLKERVSQDVVDQLATRRAIPADQVLAEFDKRATAESLRNPAIDKAGALQKLIATKYEPYDPTTLFNTDRFTTTGAPEQYISKVDAKVIRDSFTPKTYNITSAVEPLTGIMRTSLLPLSPRWNVYNIVGGAITGQAISSAKFFGYAPEAWKMVSGLMSGDESAVPKDLLSSLGGTKRDELESQFRSTRTLRRIHDAVMGADPDLDQAAQEGANVGVPNTGLAAGAKGLFNRFVQGSFNINQRFDDMYRTMGYLDGYDKSGAIEGMTEAGRIQYGLTQANQVLQDMNQLTPFELSVLRPIFPFYTYYQHILRYAMKYPIDHPLRVAITSAIAQQEEKKLGGLPTSFLNIFTWGKPDAAGNKSGINVGSLNPFTDVANLFTVAGWLGATNPVVKTIADAAGIDTDNGGPELYPTLGYDPTTGKLTNSTPNPLESLIFNTIPQTQIIGNLIGQNAEYNALLRTNPQAAAALIRTEGGLPLISRQYNLPQARIKAELNRQTAAETAKTADLKSGDLGDIAQYPSLRPVLARLATLQQSGQLKQFQPAPAPTPSTAQVAEAALAGTVGFNTLPPEQQGAYADQLAALQSPQNPATP